MRQLPAVDVEKIRLYTLPAGRPIIFGIHPLATATNTGGEVLHFGDLRANSNSLIVGHCPLAARTGANAALIAGTGTDIEPIRTQARYQLVDFRLGALLDRAVRLQKKRAIGPPLIFSCIFYEFVFLPINAEYSRRLFH